jgi:hypothetical protein
MSNIIEATLQLFIFSLNKITFIFFNKVLVPTISPTIFLKQNTTNNLCFNKIPTKGSQIEKTPNIRPNTIIDRNMLFVEAEDSPGAIDGESVVGASAGASPGHALGVIRIGPVS